MAKMRQTIGDAVLDVEGDEAAITASTRVFHQMLIDRWLRDIDEKVAALRPLLKQRRDLRKLSTRV